MINFVYQNDELYSIVLVISVGHAYGKITQEQYECLLKDVQLRLIHR